MWVIDRISTAAPYFNDDMIQEAQKRNLDLHPVFTRWDKDNFGECFAENMERLFPGKYTFFQKIIIDSSKIIIKFSDEKSSDEYADIVLKFLQLDFESKGRPSGHFYHNRQIIENSFRENTALIAVDGENFIGYMIWSYEIGGPKATIDIVEVKREYRQQGVFRRMRQDFLARFQDVCVLFADPIPQSEKIFSEASGWQAIVVENQQRRRMKTVKAALSPSDALPMGPVIAICPFENFYYVAQNLEKYQDKMKYFKIKLNSDGILMEPIIARYSADSYVALFVNGTLVAQNKVRNLFSGDAWYGLGSSSSDNLWVLNRITGAEHLFREFMKDAEQVTTHAIQVSSIPSSSSANQPSLEGQPLFIEEEPLQGAPVTPLYAHQKKTTPVKEDVSDDEEVKHDSKRIKL